MANKVSDNLSNTATWKRGLYMVLFVVIYNVSEFVMGALVLIQFGFKLITGHTNENLLGFGQDLSRYIYQIFRFLSFNTEYKPFPFDEWPPVDEQATQNDIEEYN